MRCGDMNREIADWFIDGHYPDDDYRPTELSHPHIYYAGKDRRGWRFYGVLTPFGLRIKAGCRWYTVRKALRHWGYGFFSGSKGYNPKACELVSDIIEWANNKTN